MADPLSICSATLSIIDASVRLSGRLRGVVKLWKDAPAEILALQDEILDLSVVLGHARSASEDTSTTAALRTAYYQHARNTNVHVDLERELRNIGDLLKGVDEFVSRLLEMRNIRKRWSWVKGSSAFAIAKKEQIREVRLRVSEIFTAYLV